MRKLVLLYAGFLFFSLPGYSFSRWDDLNKPTIFEKNYEYNLNKLSNSGFLSVMPWSDDYYPTEKGGISFRWNQKNFSKEVELYGYNLLNMDDLSRVNIAELSPSEKWDIFVGDKNWSLTKYERKRTKVMRTVPGSSVYDAEFKIPSWEGLCHSWAPATLLFETPEAVTVDSANGVKVPFGASDIKALLTMFMDTSETETKYLGSRCNLSKKEFKEKLAKGEITAEEYAEAMVELNGPECSDVNAGAFHIVLANQLNKRDEGFVADVTRDLEVWNQPVIGFDSEMGSPEEGATPGCAEGTAFQVYVRTKMYYISEIDMSWTSEFNKESIESETYEYILELDKDKNIIGGKWLSDHHPDFIWKRDRPDFKGYFKPLEAIYKKSIKHVRILDFIRAATSVNNLHRRTIAARNRVAARPRPQ
jgi:Transglutaminase elicitor